MSFSTGVAELLKVCLLVNASAFVVLAVMSYFTATWALNLLEFVDRRMDKSLRPQKTASQDERKSNLESSVGRSRHRTLDEQTRKE